MILSLLLLGIVVVIWFNSKKNEDKIILYKQLGSGFRKLPFIGHAYIFLGCDDEGRMTSLKMIGDDAIKQGGMSGFWHGSKLFVVPVDISELEVILKNVLEKDDLMKIPQRLLGNGSVFAPVDIWRPRRKNLVPHFGMKNLNNFVKVFNKQSEILVSQLRREVGNGTFSVFHYLGAYAVDVIGETTFGTELNCQTNPENQFMKTLEKNCAIAGARVCQPWLHNDKIYQLTPQCWSYDKTKRYLIDYVNKTVEAKKMQLKNESNSKTECDREMQSKEPKSLLELLLMNSNFNSVELQEEMLVMIIAGTDTSAMGISFTLLLLSRHPDVQDKVYEELKEVFGDSDRAVEAEDLPRLKYLEAVIKESLRLYPPVPVITRKTKQETKLPSGLVLPADCSLLIMIWSINRNPKYWGEDADVFRPERHLESSHKHPSAFMSFSQGPRACLGYQFGLMSSKTLAASILRQYRIKPSSELASLRPDQYPPIRVQYDIMMKDVNKFRIQLESRSI